MWMLWALLGCGSTPSPEVTLTSPWTASPPLASSLEGARDRHWRRSIVHLHSPWSHDACDGDPLPGGVPDPACLDDLRRALCDVRVDVAFLTDHPAHAAEQSYDALTHAAPGDEPVLLDGVPVGSVVECEGGHRVTWLPGIEDELMPVALKRHVEGDAEERDALYNLDTPEAVQAMVDAGGTVLVAHTEGREVSHLLDLQQHGMSGIEVFNLHAMFAPDKREEDLGLDPFSWLDDIAPFTNDDASAEPDLLFLAVHDHQDPSLAAWDELLAVGPMVGVGGTDAHQNVLPLVLRDGERVDSYRRMLRWFSNLVLVDDDTLEAVESGLAAGRVVVAFEVLGTPSGFDVYLEGGDGQIYEMGSDAAAGELVVTCPTLAAGSPRGTDAPSIHVSVLRDGEPWQQGCGTFVAEAGHVYRVQVDITPYHLRPFLGDDPDSWMRPFPWLYAGAIRT